jgi:hypothetical protein
LVSILILPLAIPILIFGVSASYAAVTDPDPFLAAIHDPVGDRPVFRRPRSGRGGRGVARGIGLSCDRRCRAGLQGCVDRIDLSGLSRAGLICRIVTARFRHYRKAMSDTTISQGWFTSLANPTRFFVPFGAESCLISRQRRCCRWWSGSICRLPRPKTTSRALRCRIMFIHVPAAWLAMMCYSVMAISSIGTLVWRHPLADVSAKTAAADRRRLYLPVASDRLAVGPADVGNLVGVGRAADLRVRAVFNVSGADGAASGDGRSGPRGASGGGADAGRFHQYPDHQVFGRLVEHVAPAGQRDPHGRAQLSIPRCCIRSW